MISGTSAAVCAAAADRTTRPTVPAYTAVSQALATEINAALTSNISPAQALAKAAAAANQAIASGSGS